MTRRKVVVIWLDGYENSVGEAYMAEGSMPAMARLRQHSISTLLDHGPAQRTGLAGEHLSTGMAPEAAKRWAAVSFDPATYEVTQEGTNLRPFPADLESRTVVFDMPYFDLRRAPQVRGLVNWGAHDPGVSTDAGPEELLAKFLRRFGDYPAREFIYGMPWPSAQGCRRMGEALTNAVKVRARATHWLLRDRFSDWDLALVAVSETHSAIEGLWHGFDESHPLHTLPSAGPAAEGLRSVYEAVDDLVGEIVDAFPDAAVLVCSMGGMGSNQSDVASMVLLPELLYRNVFGEARLRTRDDWATAPNGVPLLGPDESWRAAVMDLLPHEGHRTANRRSRSRSTLSLLPVGLRSGLSRLKGLIRPPGRAPGASEGILQLSLDWMPATHYQPYWRKMPAFALPSFYDGRIRINLVGRESDGVVELSRYASVCDELETLLLECRDSATGERVVDFIERPAGGGDPLTMGATEADLVVVWRGPLGIEHPRLGTIGPLPTRRTGGHTGPHGMLYIHGAAITPKDLGLRSAFDVVPTIIELLGEQVPTGLSGLSLIADADEAR